MQAILAAAILSIGGVFVGLTFLIVANKGWREISERRQRTRRRELEPAVLAFAHGEAPSILAALGGPPSRRDEPVLESILLDHVQRVRGIERERLARSLDELGFVDDYVGRLLSNRWWRRAEAAEKLGLAGAARITDALVHAMKDEVAEVRMRAAKSLGALRGTVPARSLILALNEPNRWSTIRIGDILTSMGRRVTEELMELFPRLTRAGKNAALDVLARIRPLRAVPWLHERLRDPEPDVRARAAHALGSIGDPNSGPELVRLLGDAAWPVRAMAAKALGRVRHEPAIPLLCTVLRDRQWWARANAAEALRRMGPRGVEALDRMLDDEDTYARHQAVLMLEESGVVDAQVDLLAHAGGPQRQAALTLLRRMIRAGQTGRLSELVEGHPDRRVREALQVLLALQPSGQGAG